MAKKTKDQKLQLHPGKTLAGLELEGPGKLLAGMDHTKAPARLTPLSAESRASLVTSRGPELGRRPHGGMQIFVRTETCED